MIFPLVEMLTQQSCDFFDETNKFNHFTSKPFEPLTYFSNPPQTN